MLDLDWPILEALQHLATNTSKSFSRYAQFVRAAVQSLEVLDKTNIKDVRLAEIYGQYKRSGKLSPAGLFLAFKHVYVMHEVEMMFDHISFSLACAGQMEVVRISVQEGMTLLGGIDGSERGQRRYEIVYDILWDAANLSVIGNTKSSALFAMGPVLRNWAEHEAHDLLTLARHQTSGYLRDNPLNRPKDCRTEFDIFNEDVLAICTIAGLEAPDETNPPNKPRDTKHLVEACPFLLYKGADLSKPLFVLVNGEYTDTASVNISKKWESMRGKEQKEFPGCIARLRKTLANADADGLSLSLTNEQGAQEGG